jgi:chemotaxis protein MotB
MLSIGTVEGAKVIGTRRVVHRPCRIPALSIRNRGHPEPEILSRIGRHLATAGGSIRIEGHTDSIPVRNDQFPSNWELSTQRAVNVVKFLISECGIDPRRLSAAGYGDSRPLASNDTPEGRAVNRRVNINISNK